MKRQRKFEENIKVTAINPPKSCLRCMFFGTGIDEPNGMCLLAGREIDLDTADKGTMDYCKIKKRKRKKGKSHEEKDRNKDGYLKENTKLRAENRR